MMRMKAILKQAFTTAEEKYIKQENRGNEQEGASRGFLSGFRHSAARTTAMAQLEMNIANSTSDTMALIVALTYILNKGTGYFFNRGTKHNEHSFCTYFIDELKRITGNQILDYETNLPFQSYNDTPYQWNSSDKDLNTLLATLRTQLDLEPASKVTTTYTNIVTKDVNPSTNDNPNSRYGRQMT